MEEIDASFIITGDVLGQRPMSQHKNALNLIEKQVCLKGKILRPLSAKNLELTEVEKKGIINRERLFDITGRTRNAVRQNLLFYGKDHGLRTVFNSRLHTNYKSRFEVYSGRYDNIQSDNRQSEKHRMDGI